MGGLGGGTWVGCPALALIQENKHVAVTRTWISETLSFDIQ